MHFHFLILGQLSFFLKYNISTECIYSCYDYIFLLLSLYQHYYHKLSLFLCSFSFGCHSVSLIFCLLSAFAFNVFFFHVSLKLLKRCDSVSEGNKPRRPNEMSHALKLENNAFAFALANECHITRYTNRRRKKKKRNEQ